MNEKLINIKNNVSVPLAGASLLFVLGFTVHHNIELNNLKKNLEDHTAKRISEFKVDYPHMLELQEIVKASVNRYLSTGNMQGAYDTLSLLISDNEWEKYAEKAGIEYHGADNLIPSQLVKIMKAYFQDRYEEISRF